MIEHTPFFSRSIRRASRRGSIDGNLVFYSALALLGLFVAMRHYGVFGFGTIAPISLPASQGSGDTCSGKERCIVAYLAPWCPACNSAIPFLTDIRSRAERTEEVGVKVIVGMDERPQLEEAAKKIGGTVYFDEDRSFSTAMGVTGVPSVWVIDSAGEILVRDIPLGVSGGSPDENFKYFADRYLKLGEYFK